MYDKPRKPRINSTIDERYDKFIATAQTKLAKAEVKRAGLLLDLERNMKELERHSATVITTFEQWFDLQAKPRLEDKADADRFEEILEEVRASAKYSYQ